MNEDYLWDKSGEPDAEIERLEHTLGRLRYKRPAEPLPLPATLRRPFRFSFSPPALAAAAALLLLLLAGGLWLGLNPRSSSTEDKQGLAGVSAPEEKRSESKFSGPRPPLGSGNPADDKIAGGVDRQSPAAPDKIAPRNKRPRHFSGARQSMARQTGINARPKREQLAREGEQAKAQLIMALHIASDKLNAVQKKINSNPGS